MSNEDSSWSNKISTSESKNYNEYSSRRIVSIYDEYFQYICGIYSTFLKTISLITVVLFPLVCYLLIWKTPHKMKAYGWLLMNNVVTGLLIVLLFAIWQPVPVLFDGIICAFSLGLARSNNDWNYIMFEISIVIFLNLSLSYVASLIYQYNFIAVTGPLSNITKSTKKFFIVYITYTILIDAVVIFLSCFHHDDTQKLFHHLYSQTAWENASNLLKSIYYNEKSMIAWSYGSNIFVTFFAIVLFGIVVIETLAIVLLNIKVVNSIHKMNVKLHYKLQKLQQMLYKVMLQNTIFLVLFFLIPFFVLFLCILSVFSSIYVGMVVFAVMPLYTPFSYLMIVLSVKPYRDCIGLVYKRLVGRRVVGTKPTIVNVW